ncbi:MAG: hypothetical protein ACRDYE_02995, partial [Acidimicrobiales bacterium]
MTLDFGGDDVLGCASGTAINETCFTNGLANVEKNLPTIMPVSAPREAECRSSPSPTTIPSFSRGSMVQQVKPSPVKV